MKKLIHKIVSALAAARVGFLYPELMFGAHFEVMGKLYEMILKVSVERHPVMCHVGTVLPDDSKFEIATVWVGSGVNSSPELRIKELFEENQELKERLSAFVAKQEIEI
jgi:hypothetical protein